MTLAMVLRAKAGASAAARRHRAGTPWSDMTKTGDSFYANEMVDNVLVSDDGFLHAAALLYANGHDLKDPLLSPVYGDMHGFPPTILTSGTRDLFLSNTVRVHRKLREAGRGGGAAGVRGRVARAVLSRHQRAGDEGLQHGGRGVLRSASGTVVSSIGLWQNKRTATGPTPRISHGGAWKDVDARPAPAMTMGGNSRHSGPLIVEQPDGGAP